MANNKVQLADGTTLIDLTSDTVTPQTMLTGTTAHAASGEQITGVVNLANAGTNIPLADNNTGSVGIATAYAREDHVHPVDTSRAPNSALNQFWSLNAANYSSEIPDGTDLNTLTTPGIYYCVGREHSATMSNNPAPNSAFELITVETLNTTGHILQLMVVNRNDTNPLWYRYCMGTTWGEWRKIGRGVRAFTSKTFTGTVTNEPALTANSSIILSTMTSVKEVFADPKQVLSDAEWEIVDGNINVSGTFSATGTTMTFWLIDPF